jgi:hypothetical protein
VKNSNDPVEDQVQQHAARIPSILEGARSSMSIRQFANALDHSSNTPWTVVFAVQRLEAQGVIRRNKPRDTRAAFHWALARDRATPKVPA